MGSQPTYCSLERGLVSPVYGRRIAIILILLVFIRVDLPSQTSLWFTAYYPHWAMRPLGSVPEALPPWEFDWRGITHVVHFMNGNVSKTPPYSTIVAGSRDSIDLEFCGVTNPGNGRWIHWQDSLIRIAHRHGVKVVLTIQAVDAANLNYVAADSARTDVFANYIVGYCQRKGYDGLELNWEGWVTPIAPAGDVNRLVRRLHAALGKMSPRGLLLMSPGTGDGSLYWPSQDHMVDQYNLQMYNFVHAWHALLRSNVSWYNAPLYRGSVPLGFEGQAYDSKGPGDWVEAGHDPKRIGIGMPTFGWIIKNVDELHQKVQNSGDYGYARYQQCLALLANGGKEGWDEERKVPFISGTAIRSEGNAWGGQPGVIAGKKFFATFENPRSLQEKIRWARKVGLGGVMLYDVTMDLDQKSSIESRNPLHASVSEAFGISRVPLSPPFAPARITSIPEDITSRGRAITSRTDKPSAARGSLACLSDEVIAQDPHDDRAIRYELFAPVEIEDRTVWVGYEFDSTYSFVRLIFASGLHTQSGGWFEEAHVEVFRDGRWHLVTLTRVTPPFHGRGGKSYETYVFDFLGVKGTAIRLVGAAGGPDKYVSATELRVLQEGRTP